MKTAEDGRQFHSFVRSSISPDLSISRLVQDIRIRYDLAGLPWLHLIYFSLWNHSIGVRVEIEVFDSSDASSHKHPIFARSIYHSLPRPLPRSLSPSCALSLNGLSFADFLSLSQFLSSVQFMFELWAPIQLSNVHIEDIDKTFTLRCRGCTHESLTIIDGNAPLRSACSLSTHPTWKNYRQQHTIVMLEKVCLAIMKTCPIFREWCSVDGEARNDGSHLDPDDPTHHHPRSFVTNYTLPRGYGEPLYLSLYLRHNGARSTNNPVLDFTISDWCDVYSVHRIEIALLKDGTISSLRLVVRNCEQALLFPWAQIDEDLWVLLPDVQALAIKVDEERGRNTLERVISGSMMHFVHAGKLKF